MGFFGRLLQWQCEKDLKPLGRKTKVLYYKEMRSYVLNVKLSLLKMQSGGIIIIRFIVEYLMLKFYF